MSRLAKKPISLPVGVTFTETEKEYIVKGPKGELKIKRVPLVKITPQADTLLFSVANLEKSEERAFLGTAVRVVGNMIKGVSEGYIKKLEINGVGYKAEMKGNQLILNVGYSHVVPFPEINGVSIKVEKNIITVEGIDKVLVGQTAANIRKVRKPEPYKGKGIKYSDEVIRRKEGKQVKSQSS
jgi:large subunit ribosomal protein L6